MALIPRPEAGLFLPYIHTTDLHLGGCCPPQSVFRLDTHPPYRVPSKGSGNFEPNLYLDKGPKQSRPSYSSCVHHSWIGRDNVPKRRQLKFKSRVIAQKKGYNNQNINTQLFSVTHTFLFLTMNIYCEMETIDDMLLGGNPKEMSVCSSQ